MLELTRRFVVVPQEGSRSESVPGYVIAGNVFLFVFIFQPVSQLLIITTPPIFAIKYTELFPKCAD